MGYQKLLTAANRKALPALYATDNVPAGDKVAVVKFFNPCGGQTWYLVEFDGEDKFFGYVTGMQEDEWGYSSLSEFMAYRGRLHLKIERDMYFEPTKMKDIRDIPQDGRFDTEPETTDEPVIAGS